MKNLFLCFAILFLINPFLKSQAFEHNCSEIDPSRDAQYAQVGGVFKPSSNAPNQFFRVLFVFVQFSGDDNMIMNDWTYGSLPTYANKLVNNTISSSYDTMTASDYWKTMSLGNFDFIGDIYPNVVTIKSQDYYQTNLKNYSDCNLDAIKILDSLGLDFKHYDNWKLENGQFVFSPRNGDKYLDMVYMIYRNPTFERWTIPGGIAMLGSFPDYTTHDTVKIRSSFSNLGSGITCKVIPNVHYPGLLGLVAHEFGHYLFGGNHTQHSGLMVGAPYSYRGGTFALSGWERERLGYSAYTTAYQDNFTITLSDFVTTGQVLRIPIPGFSDRYFLVENHQRINKYYDQVRQGGNDSGYDSTSTRGSGIYIWQISNGNNFPPTVDVKTANGNWDWVFVGTINVGGGFPPVMPLSGRSAVNRNTGKSDRNTRNIFWNGIWWEKWHDTVAVTKQLELTRNCMGLDNHPFNYGYNTLFTPWSSPSTYFGGNTNVALQIYSQNGTNITLKVFTTLNSCLALPPSRPQNLKVQAVNGFAALTWEPNIEPDMQYSGKYKIYRGSSTNGEEPSYYGLVATINAYFHYNPVYSWTDPNPAVGSGGMKLFYKITAVDNSDLESDKSDYDWVPWAGNYQKDISEELISEYSIVQNYPNPFNPSTIIEYSTPEISHVNIKVYDILGREVVELVNGVQDPGKHQVLFDAKHLSNGVYIYSITAKSNEAILFRQSKQMILMK